MKVLGLGARPGLQMYTPLLKSGRLQGGPESRGGGLEKATTLSGAFQLQATKQPTNAALLLSASVSPKERVRGGQSGWLGQQRAVTSRTVWIHTFATLSIHGPQRAGWL